MSSSTKDEGRKRRRSKSLDGPSTSSSSDDDVRDSRSRHRKIPAETRDRKQSTASRRSGKEDDEVEVRRPRDRHRKEERVRGARNRNEDEDDEDRRRPSSQHHRYGDDRSYDRPSRYRHPSPEQRYRDYRRRSPSPYHHGYQQRHSSSRHHRRDDSPLSRRRKNDDVSPLPRRSDRFPVRRSRSPSIECRSRSAQKRISSRGGGTSSPPTTRKASTVSEDVAVSKRRKIESPEKRPTARSPTPPRTFAQRSWRFDSPPRDAQVDNATGNPFIAGLGVVPTTMGGPLSVNGIPGTLSNLLCGDSSLLASPMGMVAQSLALTPEQLKGSRELYVGNLPPNLDVNQLIEFLNAALISIKASAWPGNPVIRAWSASDSHFAFAEFRTIEEASVGLQLNGLNCLGYSLRIGRPKTYPTEYAHLLGALPQATVEAPSSPAAALAAAQAAAGVVSGGAAAMLAAQAVALGIGASKRAMMEDRPDRLVIFDLPGSDLISEAEIRRVLGSYGVMKVFQYFEVPHSEDSPASGVCIFEYTDMLQQRAMKTGMEHRTVVGQKLRIVPAEKAVTEGRFSEVMDKAAAAGINLREELGGDLMRPHVATRCIMLTNLVTKEDLKEDKDYFEIVDDVTLECSEFGKVLAVEIPRPIPGAKPGEFDESDVGYAFVEFQTIEGAGAARKSLSGRKFGGRTVEAHYFSEIYFKEKKFKHPQPNFDPLHSSAKNPKLGPQQEDINSNSDTTRSITQNDSTVSPPVSAAVADALVMGYQPAHDSFVGSSGNPAVSNATDDSEEKETDGGMLQEEEEAVNDDAEETEEVVDSDVGNEW